MKNFFHYTLKSSYKILNIKNFSKCHFFWLRSTIPPIKLRKLFEIYCVRTRERAYYSVILWARSWWEWGTFSNFRGVNKSLSRAKIREKVHIKKLLTTNFWFFFQAEQFPSIICSMRREKNKNVIDFRLCGNNVPIIYPTLLSIFAYWDKAMQ